jgi:hypothetical protein
MSKKVKERLVLLVHVPNYEIPVPIIILYDGIWQPYENTWKYQEWLPWCKMYVNVQGHFRKDGTIALRGIKVNTSPTGQLGWKNIDKSIKFRVLEYK